MRLTSLRAAGQQLGGLSESTIRRLVKEGALPAPVALSMKKDGRPARVAFITEELDAAAAKLVGRSRRVAWAPTRQAA